MTTYDIDFDLRNVYAFISPHTTLDFDTLDGDVNELTQYPISFFSGNSVYLYLYKHLNEYRNQYIYFVIPTLKYFFAEHIDELPIENQKELHDALITPPPKFELLNNITINTSVQQYKLNGQITPYEVFYMPVKDVIQDINNKIPLSVILDPLNVQVNLDHHPSDFFDVEYNRLITVNL